MEFEAWWALALPLFFGLGWLASRSDRRQREQSQGDVASAYLRGMNFLLNEQSDRAIDAFVDVVRLEPEAVEMHFALGALFRRRGESDRAIRVHQNLADRTDLSQDQRHHALHELGLDFLKAGLIDRAEDVFNRLEGTEYAASAARQRLEIAQRTQDWPRVIEVARTVPPNAGIDTGVVTAHAWCELAERAMKAHELDKAGTMARQAWAASPEHPRPMMLLARIAMQSDAPQEAIRHFDRIAELRPEFIAFVAKDWLEAAQETGGEQARKALLERLQQIARDTGSDELALALIDDLVASQGEERATEWLRERLGAEPTLRGLQSLLAHTPVLHDNADGATLQSVLKRLAERQSRYVCDTCGFRARTWYWHCPGCNRWDSYSPRRSEGN